MNTTQIDKQTVISEWFDKLISGIRGDQAELEAGIANQDKKDMYRPFILGDQFKMAENVREESTKFFITQIVKDYFKEVQDREANPVKLALQLAESKIMVWAVIKDDDEDCEDKLFLSEAATNFRFHEHGFHISTTLVEESDSFETPNHFTTVLNG